MNDQEVRLRDAIQFACNTNISVIDGKFLCRSIGSLNPSPVVTLGLGTTVREGHRALASGKNGAVVIVDKDGVLCGIFTERDFVQKIPIDNSAVWSEPLSNYMTKDPVSELPETSIAYALNLMSNGGFRHLPIVDHESHPIGIFSVKDLIDAIVGAYTEALLATPIE